MRNEGGGVQDSLAAPKLVPASSTLPVGTLPLKGWAHGEGTLDLRERGVEPLKGGTPGKRPQCALLMPLSKQP